MTNIVAAELAQILPNLSPSEVIVDVREVEEFEEQRVPGSINVPLSTIGKDINLLKRYSKIYLICETDGRSSYAYEILKTVEISTINIIGGIFGLQNAGVSLERGDAN